MYRSIQDLLNFYSQQYHVSVELVLDDDAFFQRLSNGVVVGLSTGVGELIEESGMQFLSNPAFQNIDGVPFMLEDRLLARTGKNYILFHISPENDFADQLIRKVIEDTVPSMAKALRKDLRTKFMNNLKQTSDKRKDEIRSSIRDNEYHLQDLNEQINSTARKMMLDKRLLKLFDKPERNLKKFAVRLFADLMKLVPGIYQSFTIEGSKITGVTSEISIDHEGESYNFQPYEVTFDLTSSTVMIAGDKNENNGYIHPHVTYGGGGGTGSICWGNIGGLVARLGGELDVYGLFQLIHQYLSTYNENDPYQKIERWNPNYDEDEDNSPYCSFCDESGHEISDCEWCWWCECCEDYADHDEENCPNRLSETEEPKEEEHEQLAEAV